MFLARSPTRSRPAMRMVPISSRRSTATGGRRAMVMTVMSSISRCSASRRGSVATTWCASVVSALASASMASMTIFSAIPPISAMRRSIASSSLSKALRVCSIKDFDLTRLAQSTCTNSPCARPLRDLQGPRIGSISKVQRVFEPTEPCRRIKACRNPSSHYCDASIKEAEEGHSCGRFCISCGSRFSAAFFS